MTSYPFSEKVGKLGAVPVAYQNSRQLKPVRMERSHGGVVREGPVKTAPAHKMKAVRIIIRRSPKRIREALDVYSKQLFQVSLAITNFRLLLRGRNAGKTGMIDAVRCNFDESTISQLSNLLAIHREIVCSSGCSITGQKPQFSQSFVTGSNVGCAKLRVQNQVGRMSRSRADGMRNIPKCITLGVRYAVCAVRSEIEIQYAFPNSDLELVG